MSAPVVTAEQLWAFRAAVKARREWDGRNSKREYADAWHALVTAFDVWTCPAGIDRIVIATKRWSEQP